MMNCLPACSARPAGDRSNARGGAERHATSHAALTRQEIDETREEGRMPRTIECELTEDMVDQCVPGV